MGLLSAATLAYQILLVRVFAIEHFHHLAYLAIGIAMLGFGAAGVLLALGGPRGAAARAWFLPAAALAALMLAISPALARTIPVDPARVVWDAGEWPRLAAVAAVLALPFMLGALAILLALMEASARPGRIYGASFAGSGLGAALALAVLWGLTPARALAVPGLIAALGAAWAASGERGRQRLLGAALALAAGAWALALPPGDLRVSPYKGLPQVEAYPDARRVADRPSPLGWLVAVRAAAFRHAPGLSLAYRGPFPEQTALFIDGEAAGAITGGIDTPPHLDWLPTSLPYALGGRERVLLIAPGGDGEARSALAHGARRVVAVELHCGVVRLARAALSGAGPAPTWVAGDARGYVAQTRERFDLIALRPGGTLGGSAAGVHGLSEDLLHTVEAYREYLRRLDSDGVLAVTHWLAPPPRASVRAILTVAEALRRTGADVGRSLVVSHSWGTATVLAKPSGFDHGEVTALRRWAEERGFDLDWWPGIQAEPPALNELAEPVLYRAVRAAAASRSEAAAFASRHPFAVAPATDARPYPHHFLRPGSLRAFLRERGAMLPFAEWGFVTLVATLIVSAALATLAMVVPAAWGGGPRPQRTATGQGAAGGGARLLGYFGAIGLAYMAAEIALLPPLGLLLGHPVYALTATLAALLVCSGLGSRWSDRLTPAAAPRWIVLLAAALAGWSLLLLPVVHALASAPLIVRAAAALATLAPLGFLMGVPFPIGWRLRVGDDRRAAARAWAANGFASVIAAPLAALLALEAGWRTPMLVAALAYAAAAGLARGARGGA